MNELDMLLRKKASPEVAGLIEHLAHEYRVLEAFARIGFYNGPDTALWAAQASKWLSQNQDQD
jgi:hypothetical protein